MAKKAKSNENSAVRKPRKPYPSYQERIDAADVKIEKLNQLIAERSSLIDKTAKLLAERTEADRKSTRLNSSHPTTSRMPSSA